MSDETTVESADEELPESPIGDEVTESGDDTTTEGAEADASESGDKDHDSKLMSRWQRAEGRADKEAEEKEELQRQLDELQEAQTAQPENSQEWGEEAQRFEQHILGRVAEQSKAAQEKNVFNQRFDKELASIKSDDKKFSTDDERSLFEFMDKNNVYSPEIAYNTVFKERDRNRRAAAALRKKNATVDTEKSSIGASPAKTGEPSSKASMGDRLTAYFGK